jgi:uncharacterized membrane-anchored protein
MIPTKKRLTAALLFPILSLMALAAYKNSVVNFGQEVILPISGYDPRDLLSGHYLIYRIDYGIQGLCSEDFGQYEAHVCLEPLRYSLTRPEDCAKLIRGVCNSGRFEAGIEKYYVPEERALELEDKVRSKSASIVLALTPGGQAQVKDLLIDGHSWQEP